MLNMYSEMVDVGFIINSYDRQKLAEIIGLSHDIGVGSEQPGEEHNYAGWRMLKENVWKETLSSDKKNLLAIVMYGIFYHRSEIPAGTLKSQDAIPLHDYRTNYRTIAELVSLIRIADGLDYGLPKGSPDKIEKIEMARTSKGVECRVFPRPGENVISLVAKSYDKREVFEATFGKLTFWLPGEGGSWVCWQH